MFKRSIFALVMILIGILILVPPMVSGQDGSDSPVVFDIDEIPVIYRGERGEWDQDFTNTGAVFFHEGQFHMFRNGYHQWPSPSQVGYLTSEDGLVWTEVVEDPVFLHEQIPFNVDLALVSSGFVEDDGTWVLYFFMIKNQDPDSPSGVARATADNPLGPWEMTTELILVPGNDGEWDAEQVAAPHVLKTNDGYRMYYHASSVPAGPMSIGMATSDDGVEWAKYDDPETTDAPFADSDPVFMRESEWEGAVMADPSVMETPDGWVMFYGSYEAGFNGGAIGYGIAISEDGIAWERISDEAIIRRTMVGYRQTWYSKMIYHEGTYFVYIEANSRYGTDIFGGTYTGSLRP
jgi:predicted GH43/DUF377 family glycosyl hydrolase